MANPSREKKSGVSFPAGSEADDSEGTRALLRD